MIQRRFLLLAGLLVLGACAPITEPRPRRPIETRADEVLDRIETAGTCGVVISANAAAPCDTPSQRADH